VGAHAPRIGRKDSTTGHWEIAGVRLARPFPTYAHGFPREVVDAFVARTGRAVIGNVVASGTAVIDDYGPEHERTGAWIVYTSADSVFQVAAHEGVVPLDELYAACEAARAMLTAPHDVSRVIARPFAGSAGAYQRTGNRRDFSLEPPARRCSTRSRPRRGAGRGGKVDDLFAGRSLTPRTRRATPRGSAVLDWLRGRLGWVPFRQPRRFRHSVRAPERPGGLRRRAPRLRRRRARAHGALREDDLLFITADHGTTRPPRRPTTRASACRCSRAGRASARRARRAGDLRRPRRDGRRVARRRVPRCRAPRSSTPGRRPGAAGA
jgi:phosphopentomutase